MTLLRAIEARNALPLEAVLRQLNQLRGQSGSSGTAVSPAQSTAPVRSAPAPISFSPVPLAATPAPAPKPAAPIPPPVPVAAAAPGDLAGLWSNLMDAVGRVSKFTQSYLKNAHPVAFEKNILTVGFDPEFADTLSLVNNSHNHTLLATKLAELGHANAMIKFIEAAAPAGWARAAAPAVSVAAKISPTTAPAATVESKTALAAEKKTAPVAFNKDDFKNDPLIRKALEIFKGTIVEVRA